jgi:hypothetical protein
MIQVNKKSDQEFAVTIREKETQTEHLVTLDDKYYQNLTNGEIPKEDLIKKSFEFLLQREPKESILSKFDLRIINNYFPEYEEKIKQELLPNS